MEVRKQNGELYPAKTLYLLASGILRKFREYGFADMKSSKFYRFGSFIGIFSSFLNGLCAICDQLMHAYITLTP